MPSENCVIKLIDAHNRLMTEKSKKIEGFGLTHVGRVRTSNEDAWGVFPDLGLFVVADGMGGHAAGEVASRIAVDVLREYFENRLKGAEDTTLPFDMPDNLPDLPRCLVASTKLANLRIHEASQADRSKHGMGTTLVSTAVEDLDRGTVYVGHVGDSRAYRIRDGKAVLLTHDHSLINDYISQGLLTPEEAGQHPLKHVITRALGSGRQIEVDWQQVSLQPNDRILLCSDGLSNLVSELEIAEAAGQGSLQEGCRKLIDRALENGGDDNVTVVLLEFRAD